jgi:radical SAM protein with 4Fe4S-binding SPASM domain
MNFDRLDDVVVLAKEYGLHDVELLRFKPFGRGKRDYNSLKLTYEQACAVLPRFVALSRDYAMPLRIDCSFLPMVCMHRPDKEVMERLSVNGCDAGNMLLGVKSDGTIAGCSFCTNSENVADLPHLWKVSKHLNECRTRKERLGEPCQTCDYCGICKGGCRAVSEYLTGNPDAPDPECPTVVLQSGLTREQK